MSTSADVTEDGEDIDDETLAEQDDTRVQTGSRGFPPLTPQAREVVATKTIAQGDTRQSGLQRILSESGAIYDAVRNMPWPGEAAVSISLVHIAKGHLCDLPALLKRLDGREVTNINSRLLNAEERPDPRPLRANKGLCYVGSYVLGMGFVLTPEERKALIRQNAANEKLIFPYLGGEEVNTSPTQDFDRFVINFGDMSLQEAERWPDLLHIVREKVKPERDRVNRAAHRKYWWHYADKRPALTAALGMNDRCLVTSRVTKHLCFSLQDTDRVFAESMYVFILKRAADFGTLQSRIHELWARLLSSSMKTDLRYAASDCFDTFPFPDSNRFANSGQLNDIGKRLYDARAKLMVGRDQGLTTTYNQLKDAANRDPAIVELRHLHEEMDRAVLAAYGWSEIDVPLFETPTTAEQRTAFERFSDAVIDRLFALNAERAAAEDATADDPATTDAAAAVSETSGPRRSPRRAPRKPVATAKNASRAKPGKRKAS